MNTDNAPPPAAPPADVKHAPKPPTTAERLAALESRVEAQSRQIGALLMDNGELRQLLTDTKQRVQDMLVDLHVRVGEAAAGRMAYGVQQDQVAGALQRIEARLANSPVAPAGAPLSTDAAPVPPAGAAAPAPAGVQSSMPHGGGWNQQGPPGVAAAQPSGAPVGQGVQSTAPGPLNNGWAVAPPPGA